MKPHPGLAILLFACSIVSCIGVREDVEGNDRSSFFPSFRASLPVDSVENSQPLWLDFDFSFTSGSDRIALGSGEFLKSGGAIFSGPDEVDARIDLYTLSAAARVPISIAEGFHLDPFAGLGYGVWNLELRSPSQSQIQTAPIGNHWLPEILIGARLAFEMTKDLEIYGQASQMQNSLLDDGRLKRLETGIRVRGDRSWAIFAGWSWWRLQSEGEHLFDSDIDFRFSGPVLGVELLF